MNKKFLTLVMSLIVVSMMVSPIIGVNGEKKETLSYHAVHDPVSEPSYWGISIPSNEPKSYVKTHCDVPAYVINIGGGLVDSNGDGYKEFDGGTTYLLDRDFTYEGTMQIKTQVCYDELLSMYVRVMEFFRHGVFTFTETAGSIHTIDGTLEFFGRSEAKFNLDWDFISSEADITGHGTGDLNGVTLKATNGPLVYTLETGKQWTAQEGTITGWPTHLNKPLADVSADIYIQHTYRGDLIVDIGVGDPSNPTWSQHIKSQDWYDYWDDVDLTIDLTVPTTILPPDGDQWYLKIYDCYYGDQGQIIEFSITYDGTTYTSTDTPVPIYDYTTSYAYIPS